MADMNPSRLPELPGGKTLLCLAFLIPGRRFFQQRYLFDKFVFLVPERQKTKKGGKTQRSVLTQLIPLKGPVGGIRLFRPRYMRGCQGHQAEKPRKT